MSSMSTPAPFDASEYGRNVAIGVSVGMHVVLLLLGLFYTYFVPQKEQPKMNVNRVRLGGPANMELGGKKHKAPVVGKMPKPTEAKPTKKDAPKKPPKVADSQLGLKKKEEKKKEDPKPKEPKQEAKDKPKPKKEIVKPKPKKDTSESEETSASEVKTPPPPDDDSKAPTAIGGLGGEKGVALDLGDGAESVNLADLEFIAYYKSVQAALLERWNSKGLKGGATQIRFEITRTGEVQEVTVAKSSGKPYLDGPAKRAVMGAEFPPLPQGYDGQVLVLNIIFNYDRQ